MLILFVLYSTFTQSCGEAGGDREREFGEGIRRRPSSAAMIWSFLVRAIGMVVVGLGVFRIYHGSVRFVKGVRFARKMGDLRVLGWCGGWWRILSMWIGIGG